MPPVTLTSSPDVADQLLEVVGPGFATDWTLARGTNLSKIEIEEKREETKFLPGFGTCRSHRCGVQQGSCRQGGPS